MKKHPFEKKNLVRTFGYELTALPRYFRHHKHHKEWVSDKCEWDILADGLRIKHAINVEFRRRGLSEPFCEPLLDHFDIHCLELRSIPSSFMEDIMFFYDAATKAFKKYNFVPQLKSTVCGGNHWHVGFILSSDFEKEVFTELMRLCFTNYFIPWIFLSYSDTESASNLLYPNFGTSRRTMFDEIQNTQRITNKIKTQIQSQLEEKGIIDSADIFNIPQRSLFAAYDNACKAMMVLMCNPQAKDSIYLECLKLFYNNKYNWFTPNGQYNIHETKMNVMERPLTFEFRCFRAPESRDEFIQQVEFVSAMVELAEANVVSKNLTNIWTLKHQPLTKNTFEGVKGEFKELCDRLKLNYKNYDWLVRKHLRPRFNGAYSLTETLL